MSVLLDFAQNERWRYFLASRFPFVSSEVEKRWPGERQS